LRASERLPAQLKINLAGAGADRLGSVQRSEECSMQ